MRNINQNVTVTRIVLFGFGTLTLRLQRVANIRGNSTTSTHSPFGSGISRSTITINFMQTAGPTGRVVQPICSTYLWKFSSLYLYSSSQDLPRYAT
jgi:hypothetical protein